MASGGDPLFACTNCHTKHPFSELSVDQQLCRSCRKKHPLVCCSVCRMEFYLMRKTNDKPICKRCRDNTQSYGQPKSCQYCHIRAAFKGSKCANCTKSEKKYGSPVVCEQCRVKCAFAKSEESRAKVDGKILCMLCTQHFLRHLQKQRKRAKEKNDDHVRPDKHQQKRKKTSTEYRAVDEMKSRLAAVESASNNRSASNSPMIFGLQNIQDSDANRDTPTDTALVNQISEIASLKDEVAVLKKQLQSKERAILEKDKKIHSLEAATWQHGKELREKTQKLEKELMDIINNLNEENRNLKKQLSQATKAAKRTDTRADMLS
ncbi:protein FAM76A-like isoform X2 [Rhopilema esculentum]|uniref:protein FAM76A-like isoform X2 n=1 Tax=Rhopilema esculentum TaxID=499914 RepID=UPI0031D29950